MKVIYSKIEDYQTEMEVEQSFLGIKWRRTFKRTHNPKRVVVMVKGHPSTKIGVIEAINLNYLFDYVEGRSHVMNIKEKCKDGK